MTPRFVVESARLAGTPLLRAQSDSRLVDLVRAGNERAFEAIVDRYRRPLLRYCARLLPAARAEDAVQQTFLNAHGAMQHHEAELELRPWLYRIARNACLNTLRENGWSHEQIDDLRRGTESAHDVVERRNELRAVVKAVHTLPERQREAVILRELEGRSYDEIAAELESTEGAVRQLLNRARNTLRTGATAVTPIWLLDRLYTPGAHRVMAHLVEATGQEGLRIALARAAGAAAASLALAFGASHAPPLAGGGGTSPATGGSEASAPLSAATSAPGSPAAGADGVTSVILLPVSPEAAVEASLILAGSLGVPAETGSSRSSAGAVERAASGGGAAEGGASMPAAARASLGQVLRPAGGSPPVPVVDAAADLLGSATGNDSDSDEPSAASRATDGLSRTVTAVVGTLNQEPPLVGAGQAGGSGGDDGQPATPAKSEPRGEDAGAPREDSDQPDELPGGDRRAKEDHQDDGAGDGGNEDERDERRAAEDGGRLEADLEPR